MKDNEATKSIPLLDKFYVGFHVYIVDFVDVKVDDIVIVEPSSVQALKNPNPLKDVEG